MDTCCSSGLDIWGAPPPIPTVHLPLSCLSFRVESALSLGQFWLPEGASSNQAWSPGTCSPVVTAVPLSRGTKADLEGVVLPGLSWLSGVYWEDHQGPLFLCPLESKCLCWRLRVCE